MSRRSKRRRTQHGQAATPDGFEFLDDRAERGPVAPLPATKLAATSIVTRGPATPKKRVTWVARPRDPETLDAEATAPAPLPSPAGEDRAPEVTETAVEASIHNTPVASVEATATEVVEAVTAATAVAPQPAAVAPPVQRPPQPTLGELLVRAREARHLSLEAASARTRIGVKMLHNLEGDRFEEFAATAYARGSLRAYGAFLGLDVTALMQRFDERMAPAAPAVEDTPAAAAPPPVVASEPRRRPRTGAMQWGRLAAVAGGVAAAGLGWGVFTLATRNPVELRPRAGLTQIEDELRRSQAAQTEAAPRPATQAGVVPAGAEDTASPAPDTTAPLVASDAGATPAPATQPAPTNARRLAAKSAPVPVTDMVPVSPPLPTSDAASRAASEAAPPVIPAAALILQATAVGPCAIRVQVDADAAGAVLHEFAAGESLSWVAERSFRLTPRRGAHRNLQLLLNGKPIATPVDGRSVRVDAATLEPAAATPRRRKSTRTRPRTTTTRTTSAPRPQPAPAIEPHGGQPPPR